MKAQHLLFHIEDEVEYARREHEANKMEEFVIDG